MRWLRFIDNPHRQSHESGIRTFVTLIALTYSWNIAPCIAEDRKYPDSRSPRNFYDPCENAVRRSLGSVGISDSSGEHRRRALLIRDHVIPRLSAAALLRDNLLSCIGHILLQCLDEDIRVAFERLHDAFLSRHIPIYDILPILPYNRGKSLKQQIHTVLQIIERIGGPFVSGYASIAKIFVRNDEIELNSAVPNDLLSSIDDRIVTSIAVDKQRNIELPITEEELFTEVMYGLRNGWTSIELRTVAALMSNIPNFDTTNPEVPRAIRLVASHMNSNPNIDNNLLDFLSNDKLESPDILVKTVLERIELSENSSEVLRESVGILLQSFDTKPWDRESIIGASRCRFVNSGIFDAVAPDYYPSFVVNIAKTMKDHSGLVNSLRIDSKFYDDDTQVLLESLTRFHKLGKSTKKLDKSLRTLLSFVSRKNKNFNDLRTAVRSVSFHEVLMDLSALNAPCLPRKLLDAAEKLRSIVTEDLPWIFAYGDETSSENPLKLIVSALVNLRNAPISRQLRMAIDNTIFQTQSNRLLGTSSVLYEERIIFQRPDSYDVELDMYSLLSRIPSVFDDKKFAPLLVLVTKANFLDYLGYKFNKLEHNEPKQLLVALLKRALEIKAVRAIKPLLIALNLAINQLEEPLLINLYTTVELQRILEILPNIHRDPRYIPLKILFEKKNLFSHMSWNFNFTYVNSTLERVKLILRTVALRPVDITLAESINFALRNLDGPPLPVRAFTREDFVYLVNNLLINVNHSRVAILQSPLYNDVADWHPSLRGSPELILSRILNYPVEGLSKNVELARIVEDAEISLNEAKAMEFSSLRSKTLRTIYDQFPNDQNFRVAKLLFETENLAILAPKLNVTELEDLAPREATRRLMKHLAYVKRQRFLSKCITSALKATNDSKKFNSRRNLASDLREMLIDPFDSKFESLMRELKKINYRDAASSERSRVLKHFLHKLRKKSRSSSLRRSTRISLAQVFPEESDFDPKKRRIGKVQINDVLGLLPKRADLNPLRRLLTDDWIRGVLPANFTISKFWNPLQLLRTVLALTRDNRRVRKNRSLVKTISSAEQSLGVWAPRVAALRRTIGKIVTIIYQPTMELLSAQNLNKLNITLPMNPRGSMKQRLLDLLDRVASNPRVHRDDKIRRSVDLARRDVIAFGVDTDFPVITAADLIEILSAIPSHIPIKYPNVHKLFTAEHTPPEHIEKYNDILESQDSIMDLLIELSNSSDTLGNRSLATDLAAVREDIDRLVKIPFVMSYRMRSLLREFRRVRDTKIDFVGKLIIPEVNFANVTDPSDDVAILYAALETALFKSHARYDFGSTSDLLSFQRDLESVVGPHKVLEGKLPATTIARIVNLIPPGIVYEPIRSVIQSRQVFNRSTAIKWRRYRSDEEKLGAILKIIESTMPHDPRLEQSLIELRRYFVSRFDFVTDKETKLLERQLHGIGGNTDLVPLKLFLTRENLLKYLPKNFAYSRHRSAREALIGILDVLQEVQSLKRRKNLYEAMTSAREILPRNQSTRSDGEVRKSAKSSRLMPRDLRFLLALKIEDSELREFLNSKKMLRSLPNDFEFLVQMTFKAKAVHLFGQLMRSDKDFREKSVPLHRLVEMLPDVPSIADEQLQPLVGIIPRNTLPNFTPIRKLMRASTLARLLPGDFEIQSFENSTSALREVLRILELTCDRGNERLRSSIVILLNELKKKKSNIFVARSAIGSDELQSLIDEIPFANHAALRKARNNFTVTEILSLLPQEFDAHQFATKKSKLMGLLDAIASHSGSEKLRQPIKIMLNVVSIMPDAPRIRNADITKVFSKIPISSADLKALTTHCAASKLAARLPINFDVNRYDSNREKLFILLKYCNETKSVNNDIDTALSNAMTLAKKLPTTDITGSRVNEIVAGINCGNFSATRWLNIFLSKRDAASLLPWNFDLESPTTFKQRIEYLLKALVTVRELKSKKYEESLKMLLSIVKKMPDRVEISENVVTALRNLTIMEDERSRMCGEYLTFPNVVRAIPPNFDVDKFPNDESRLSALLLHFNKSQEFRGNRGIYESCKFVDETLSRKLKTSTLERLKDLVNDTPEYSSLRFFLLSNKDKILDELTIPHGYEYENFNDTLRIFLRSLLSNERVLPSKALGNSIVSLLGTLPKFHIVKFDVDEAVSKIPKTNDYNNLRIFLRCADVTSYLHGAPSVPSDYGAKRLLLVILNNLPDSSLLDEETLSAIDKLRNEVKREVREQEVEDMFKQLRNYDTRIEKLKAIRSFYVAEGPEKIFGPQYREKYPNKLKRLKALREKLISMLNKTENHELQRSLEYLTRVMKKGTSVLKKLVRFIDDIDVNSLLAALPKTQNDTTILGLVRFFSNPRLLHDLKLKKNPYDYKTKGVLLRAIILKGRDLESVKRDTLQSQALEYIKDKIIANGRDDEPLELKNYAKNSNLDVDTIGLLKALDTRAVNVTAAVRIVRFLETEYNPMLHGLGFDQVAYETRGSYLRAFLRHLIENSAVPKEVRLNAKLLLPAVVAKGLGAEPVDMNEGIVSDNRISMDQLAHRWVSRYVWLMDDSSRNLPASLTPAHRRGGQFPDNFEAKDAMLKNRMKKIIQYRLAIPRRDPYYRKPNDLIIATLKNATIVEIATRKKGEILQKRMNDSRNSIDGKERQLASKIRRSLRQLSSEIIGDSENRNTKSETHETSKTGMTLLNFEKRSANREKRRVLTDEEMESATFHPDKVLYEPNARMILGPEESIEPEDTKHIISMDEADKISEGKKPVTPIKMNPDEFLPATGYAKTIPHRLLKNPKSVDLITRKLFVRDGNVKTKWIKVTVTKKDPRI